MTDSGETAPTPHPSAGHPPIPPRPPAPVVPPYAAAGAQPPPAAQSPAPIPQEQVTQPLYPTPPQYETLPYPSPQYPAHYAAPVQGGPPHAYAPPAGYAPPPQGYGPYVPSAAPPPLRRGAGLGVVAFVLAVVAALGATVVGCLAGFNIGLGTGREIALRPMDIDFDWSILTPVREWVLWGEIAFWAGTVLGTWALVQGIIAIVKDRGRGWGVAAVVIAVIGPIAFAVGVQGFLAAGFASGASIGG